MQWARRKRVRRVAKWVGLVFLVSIVGVDVASAAFGCRSTWPYLWLDLGGGQMWLALDTNGQFEPAAFRAWRNTTVHHRWWVERGVFFNGGWQVIRGVGLPLWMFAASVAFLTGWLWYRDRRDKRPGLCVKCGYDLRGLAAGVGRAAGPVCPECGTAVG